MQFDTGELQCRKLLTAAVIDIHHRVGAGPSFNREYIVQCSHRSTPRRSQQSRNGLQSAIRLTVASSSQSLFGNSQTLVSTEHWRVFSFGDESAVGKRMLTAVATDAQAVCG
jgi:hypothetical protein